MASSVIYGKYDGSTYSVKTAASGFSLIAKTKHIVEGTEDAGNDVPAEDEYFVLGMQKTSTTKLYMNEMWGLLLCQLDQPSVTVHIKGKTLIKGTTLIK